MKHEILSLFQPELIHTLKNLSSQQLSLIDLSENDILSKSIRENSKLLAHKLVPLLHQLDKENLDNYNFFNSYYTFLIIADDLETIVDLLSYPRNITEYTFFEYAVFLLNKPETDSLKIEKLNKIILSSVADGFSVNFARILIEILNSVITFKEFNNKFFEFYKTCLQTFSNQPTFTSTFFRLHIFLLQFSVPCTDLINSFYTTTIDLQLEFSQMLINHVLGIIALNDGHIDKSLDFSTKSLEFATLNLYRNRYTTKNNIAITYTTIYSFDKAQDLYLELYHQFPQNIIFALNLATNYTFLNKYEEGMQVINEFEANIGPFKNHYSLVALETKFVLCLRLNRLSDALKVEKEASEVERLVSTAPTNSLIYQRMIAQRYQYEGNFSLAKQKMEEAVQIALDLYQLNDILSNYIMLIEMQLDLVISRPSVPEFKNQLFTLIDMIIKLSEEQNIIYQKVKLLILRSAIYRHYNLVEEASNDLKQAKNLAQLNNLDGSFKKITLELSSLTKSKPDEFDADVTSVNFLKRIKSAFKLLVGSSVSNGEMRKIQYTVFGVLILTNTGLSVFNYFLSDKLESDPNLISGLILAINSFISDLAKSKGVLKSISHENLSLILEPIEDFMCVTISSCECFEVKEKTRKFASISRDIISTSAKEINRGIIKEYVTEKLIENVKLAFKI